MKSEVKRLKEIISIIESHHVLKDKSPSNIRSLIEDLGPTFIKFGQIMASRNDIIPKAYCDEFIKLRSDVKPMNFEEVNIILTSVYGDVDKVFKTINKKPIGSASIAQVHKAKLLNGEDVAIKVQRNNIKEMMMLDTKLIKKAVSFLNLNKAFGNILDINSFIDEMYDAAKEEMNFTIEKSHMKEFAEYNSDVNYLKVIKVYSDISYENVLVMEYVDGFNINNKEKLIESGYDLKEISLKLCQNYIKQAIDDGFYHADPHPDNIKINDGKIVYLDFGMMGRLSNKNKKLLGNCISAIVRDDIKEVGHILVSLDVTKNDIDYMKLYNDIKTVLDQNKTTELSNIDVKAFISDMYELLNSNSITLPRDIAMLIRGIVIISGLLEDICPELNLMQVLKNYFNPAEMINLDNIKISLYETFKSGSNMMMLPVEVLSFLKGVNTGELKINLNVYDSKEKSNNNYIFHLQIILVILIVGLFISLAILALSFEKFKVLFYVLLICILFLSICLCFSFKKRK